MVGTLHLCSKSAIFHLSHKGVRESTSVLLSALLCKWIPSEQLCPPSDFIFSSEMLAGAQRSMHVAGGAAERCRSGEYLLQSVLKRNTWRNRSKEKLTGDAQTVSPASKQLHAFHFAWTRNLTLPTCLIWFGLAYLCKNHPNLSPFRNAFILWNNKKTMRGRAEESIESSTAQHNQSSRKPSLFRTTICTPLEHWTQGPTRPANPMESCLWIIHLASDGQAW